MTSETARILRIDQMGFDEEVLFSRGDQVLPLAHLPPVLWGVVCGFLADGDRYSLGLSCRRMSFVLSSFVGLELVRVRNLHKKIPFTLEHPGNHYVTPSLQLHQTGS